MSLSLIERKKALSEIQDEKYKLLLAQLFESLEDKTRRIRCLEDKVDELELRLADQEKYSSKDCIIIENCPLVETTEPLSHQVCSFFENYLNYKTSPSNFKACHLLGKWSNKDFPPAIIIKFIYFGEKDLILSRKSSLARARNPFNQRPIFIKERLPEDQRKLKSEAENLGLITTTHNASVKLFKKNAGGKFQSFVIKNGAELYENKPIAVPKVERSGNYRQISSNIDDSRSRSELGSEKLSVRSVNRDAWQGDAINQVQIQSQSEFTNTSKTGPVISSLPQQSNSQREHCLVDTEKLVTSNEKTEVVTATSIATPSSTKSFLKRLRESPQDDDEGNEKLLNEFLQNSKNLKIVDSKACRSVNSGDANDDKEAGEISEQDKSDGETD